MQYAPSNNSVTIQVPVNSNDDTTTTSTITVDVPAEVLASIASKANIGNSDRIPVGVETVTQNALDQQLRAQLAPTNSTIISDAIQLRISAEPYPKSVSITFSNIISNSTAGVEVHTTSILLLVNSHSVPVLPRSNRRRKVDLLSTHHSQPIS